jgi:hypothetical protein
MLVAIYIEAKILGVRAQVISYMLDITSACTPISLINSPQSRRINVDSKYVIFVCRKPRKLSGCVSRSAGSGRRNVAASGN